MNDRKILIERRQHIRYLAKLNTLAVLKSNTKRLEGQIIDISLGGLSFNLFDQTFSPDEKFDLSIHYKEKGFCLEHIAYRVTSSQVTEGDSLFSNVKLQRVSLQFEDLAPRHRYELEAFITRQTNGPAY